MHVIILPVQIKEGHKEDYLKAVLENGQGAVTEPGCVRFDVIQDGGDPNRIWFYEVYRDEAALQAHLQTPHFAKLRATAARKGWTEEGPTRAGRGSFNIWPPDEEWK